MSAMAETMSFDKDIWTIGDFIATNGDKFRIPYKITNATIEKISSDIHSVSSLVIDLNNSTSNGTVEIKIPRNLLDPGMPMIDHDYIILIDNIPLEFTEVKGNCFRDISVNFPQGAKIIEIVGTALLTQGWHAFTFVPPIQIYSNLTYQNGQTAIIEGCTSLATNDGDVIIDVSDSSGTIIQTLSVIPEIDGTFSTHFIIDDKSNNGNYVVSATYGNYTAVPEFPITILVLVASIAGIILMRTKLQLYLK